VTSADLAILTRRLIEEGFGQGNLAVLDELMADDVVEHQRGNRPGREGAKEVARTLHAWMGDFSLEVQDLAVSGDIVWTRNQARGVNTGSVFGNPATNRPVEVDVFDVVRFAGGRVVEHWGVADQLGMLRQIGAIGGQRPGA
jgi:predicted ester cyclase